MMEKVQLNEDTFFSDSCKKSPSNREVVVGFLFSSQSIIEMESSKVVKWEQIFIFFSIFFFNQLKIESSELRVEIDLEEVLELQVPRLIKLAINFKSWNVQA